MKKVSVAFIGVGGYGATNINALLSAEREDVVIAATVDPYNTHPSLTCPHFSSLEEMYGAGITPDLAVISTPIRFHTEQILACLSHGSNVMCEKPITGDVADIPLLREAEEKYGRFIAIGYQWSYSATIQRLKADVLSGKYGKARFMKTMILWPRDKNYFTRSTGWAGKIMHGGKLILDSVINNATAHYLHNILYILGENTESSAEAKDITATLLRTNDIETFDTVTAKFSLSCGAHALFIASHTTDTAIEPCFSYEFEKGTVTYSEEQAHVIGKTDDGEVIDYGDPFYQPSDKILACVDMIKEGIKTPICGVRAAKAQAEFVAELHRTCEIRNASPETIREQDNRLYIEGLREKLTDCYQNDRLLTL